LPIGGGSSGVIGDHVESTPAMRRRASRMPKLPSSMLVTTLARQSRRV
jgi:hypothetical protein